MRTADQLARGELSEIGRGLSRTPKELPPKFFYDERGSELFERITGLPEYYLTRKETEILTEWAPAWAAELCPASLVEFGPGAMTKTRIVLDAVLAAGIKPLYVPVDVSATFLARVSAQLAERYSGLDVSPLAADMAREIRIRMPLRRPAAFLLLGSTIGNFDAVAAVALLSGIARALKPGDRFVMGADLRKDVDVLEAAYNDPAGITAEFNRNMLRVLNARAGADFDPDAFEHSASYDRRQHRIEMHLVSLRDQQVRIPGAGVFDFAAGEALRTEISCKYDRSTVSALFAAAGFWLRNWVTDREEMFALAEGAPIGG